MKQSDAQPDKGDWRKPAKRIAATVAVVGLLGWVIWGAWQDAREIDWTTFEVAWGLVALSMVLYAAGFVWQGFVWVVMIRTMGYPLGWLAGIRAAVISQLGNYVPGKVLIVVFRAQAAARHGVPTIPVASSIVLETLLRNLVATLLVAGGLLLMGAETSYLPALAILAVVSIIFAHPAVFHAITNFALRKLGREALPSRIGFGTVLLLLGLYTVYWALQGIAFWLLLRGVFGVGLQGLIGAMIALMAAQIASTLAVFAPTGLGAMEFAVAGVLQLANVVPTPQLAALVLRLWRTVTEMLEIGGAWLLPAGDNGQAPDLSKAGGE